MTRLAMVVALLTGAATPLAAQVSVKMDSHGSQIVVTSWIPEGAVVASLLLVPGWGGGPTDVLGMGKFLSSHGVEVFVLSPRGWHDSGGEASFSNALEDIRTAVNWARQRATHEVVIGGHSFGGGMALAYAAQDSSVRQIISVAGTDHAELIRQYVNDPQFAAVLKSAIASSVAPEGPIRADVESTLVELLEGQAVFGLRENAAALADRAILMFGGWEDVNTTIDEYLLPFYRALRSAGATDVTFRVFHTDHGFGNVRKELQQEVLGWLVR